MRIRAITSAVLLVALVGGLPTGMAAASQFSEDGMLWPVTGNANSEVGWRIHPLDGSLKYHEGRDISAQAGTPVYAAFGGEVTTYRYGPSCGGDIVVTHSDGYQTRYLHVQTSGNLVSGGDQVVAGQQLATVIDTDLINVGKACATGDHLHFEIHLDGEVQDWDNSIPYGTPVTAGTEIPVVFEGLSPATGLQTGTPSWAMPDTEQAVEIGVLDPSVAGDDRLQRHEVAVIFDRLGLLYGQPQPASGNWVTGTPSASIYAMGRMVSRGYWSPTVTGSTDVPRTHMAMVFDRAGFVAGEPVAAPGAWETGTQSWAHTVMGRSVSAGLFSKDVPGDRTLTRYELAVVLGRLDMLASWRKGTPAFAVSAMTEAVDQGLLSAAVTGADVLERDETALLLDRLGLLTANATAPSGNWETGTRTWSKPSMSKAVAQGIWASHVEGSDTVTRMELALVLDRLGFLAGQPVAAAGTWEIGTPSWAYASMGRAVSAGIFSTHVRGDEIVNRYVFAVVVVERLGPL